MYCQWELEFIANCFFAPAPFGCRPYAWSRIASIRVRAVDVRHTISSLEVSLLVRPESNRGGE